MHTCTHFWLASVHHTVAAFPSPMRKGGKKRGAAGGSKTAQQQRLTSFALPLLKKPMEVIRKQVGVKGAYWDGR